MEYIQCSHCNKKYGVNDKIRAATGRNITCKNCQQAFEIILFETPTPSVPESTATDVKNETLEPRAQARKNSPNQPKSQRQARSKPEPIVEHKKKLSPSMLLGIAILLASIYAFYQDRSVNVGEPFVATETPKPSPNAAPVTNHEEQTTATTEPKTIIHKNLSEACKAIAAQEWVIDYTMMHGMPDGREYVHSIDESLQNTAKIRKECGSSKIVQEVLASAKQGVPPKWLEMHVSALITLKKHEPHF